MRVVALCALAALLMTYASAAPEFVQEFEAFKAKYGRRYGSSEEEARRFKVFATNMRKAAELQLVNPHAKFGANEFADVSEAEFKTRHNGERFYRRAVKTSKKLDTIRFSAEEKAAADNKQQDWRPKGAVTAVKNQGQCGSCWSFSTTGGIEGQWFLAGNTLTSLSEQELVSCDTIDQGCNGGLMDNAFTWLIQSKNGSIVTEASYPYVSGDGNVPACSLSGKQFGAKIDSFKNVNGNENTDMAAFVYSSGPLSIAVDAESWQLYMGGIMTNCVAGQLDHGVLIVGYDDTATPAYWIIKNSWGASWGENGYIRVEKGTGQCSIGQYQCSSIVSKAGPTPAPTPAPGPNPTPAPGPSPTPAPGPAGPNFVQKTCVDRTCSQCSEQQFPTNACIKRGSESFQALCATDAVIVSSYTTGDCSGTPVVTSNPKDVCSIIFEKSGDEHFVQNECRNGPKPHPTTPAPPGPTPPPAPTPTPAPNNNGTFTQMQCQDAACSQGCESQTFPQNTCLSLNGGGSAIAVCQPSDLLLTIYSSTDCSGAGQQVPQQINTCVQDSSGSYLENICSAGQTQMKTSGMKTARRF